MWEKTLGSASHEPWWVSLRNRLGGDLGEPEEDVIARWRSYKNELTEAKDLRPGVRELFDELREAEIACAVASSSPQAWVEGHSRRFGLWDQFVAVATRDDVGFGRTKPHPDLFLLAAESAGVAPERCLVIEDSHHGTVAAQRAGMVCLAAANAMTASQDLSAAARIVGSLGELAELAD